MTVITDSLYKNFCNSIQQCSLYICCLKTVFCICCDIFTFNNVVKEDGDNGRMLGRIFII